MKILFRLVILVLLSGPASLLWAQQPDGGYPESYLLRHTGARAVALGGAYTAVVNEPAALFYNPAGLAFMSERAQVSTMFTLLEFGRQHNMIAYGQTFGEFIGIGAGVNNFTAGTFTARNGAGDPLGEYSNQQLAVQGGFGIRIAEASASIGVAGKYLLNTLKGPNIRGDGWAIDIGTKIQVAKLLSVGIAVDNIAGEMKWNNEAALVEKIPFTLRAGVAAEFGFDERVYTARTTVLGSEKVVREQANAYALVSLEGSIRRFDRAPSFALGVEIAPAKVLAFRGGTAFYADNTDGSSRWFNFDSYGVGIAIKPDIKELPFQFSLEYALASDVLANKSISHHLALLLKF